MMTSDEEMMGKERGKVDQVRYVYERGRRGESNKTGFVAW
jgi:hypothetical protein